LFIYIRQSISNIGNRLPNFVNICIISRANGVLHSFNYFRLRAFKFYLIIELFKPLCGKTYL
jgi:hypothetical protein